MLGPRWVQLEATTPSRKVPTGRVAASAPKKKGSLAKFNKTHTNTSLSFSLHLYLSAFLCSFVFLSSSPA